jgi:uncharacterized protein
MFQTGQQNSIQIMNRHPLGYSPALLVTAAMLLASVGCGTTSKSTFYQLEQLASAQLTGIERGIAIGVGPVKVAEYLDRPQVVTSAADHKLNLSELNRWAEPLKVSIPRVIGVNLSNMLKTNRIFLLPRKDRVIPLDFKVVIDIARFDGKLGGNAMLTARWTLYGKEDHVILTKVTIVNEPTGRKDYEHLIAAENRALQALSSEIADAIETNR